MKKCLALLVAGCMLSGFAAYSAVATPAEIVKAGAAQ